MYFLRNIKTHYLRIKNVSLSNIAKESNNDFNIGTILKVLSKSRHFFNSSNYSVVSIHNYSISIIINKK